MNFQDILLDLGLSYVFTLLKKIAKTPTEKRKWRNVMLKIAKNIFAAYGDDEEFQSLAK